MPDATRARDLRAELDSIAPYPPRDDATASQVAKYLLVRAQIGIATMGLPGAEVTPDAVARVGAQFAAAHILRACEGPYPDMARDLAGQIAAAWHDGGEIAEWIWQHLNELGDDADGIAKLARDLAETAQPDIDQITVSREALATVLSEAEGFIGGKDNAAFTQLAEAAGAS